MNMRAQYGTSDALKWLRRLSCPSIEAPSPSAYKIGCNLREAEASQVGKNPTYGTLADRAVVTGVG